MAHTEYLELHYKDGRKQVRPINYNFGIGKLRGSNLNGMRPVKIIININQSKAYDIDWREIIAQVSIIMDTEYKDSIIFNINLQ